MGNPCSSGHPHKVTGHSVQLQHQRLTAYWPALISKNTITRIEVLFSSIQPWITSGALYLGLGLVGGNAIPTKERRGSMESHSYDGVLQHTEIQRQGRQVLLSIMRVQWKVNYCCCTGKKIRSSGKLSSWIILSQGEVIIVKYLCSLYFMSGGKTVKDLALVSC